MIDRIINAPISKIVEAIRNKNTEVWKDVEEIRNKNTEVWKDSHEAIVLTIAEIEEALASLGGEGDNHTYFRAVPVLERLPIKDGEYAVRSVNESKPEFELTDTVRFVNGKFVDAPNWQHLYWLEQVQPPHPSEREVLKLLERASWLVGSPATNISSSTDLACESWQKDYKNYADRYIAEKQSKTEEK